MAQQLTDKLFYRGGYADESMSVKTFEELSALTAMKKFVGLTTTVTDSLKSNDGKSIPVDVWLSEGRGNSNWVVKNIPPIDDLSQLEIIPENFIPKGFEVLLKSGEKYIFNGVDDENNKQWVADISRDEFDETVSDAVKIAIDNVTSGASEAFDTLKEIEEWIKANSGSTSTPGADGKDGITPQLKIENGAWFVSYNEGETWNELGKATGEKGEKGDQGIQGEKGEKGNQGEQGKSAYEIWLQSGNEGSEIDFLASLKGEKGAIDEESLALLKKELYESATTYTDGKIAEIEIPSLEGYATETFVKNAIADAQLSGETEIDLSGYATKDDIKDLASKDDIKIYSSGTGISVVDNKINVLIETGDTENRNYIKVNEDNSLSVEEIGLDDAVTTEDIQVNGGAWADAIKDIYGDTIPVGTSFQDFLKAMSCKEYFVSDVTISSSFTVTCGELKPGLTGAKSGDIVEVGTLIELNEVTGTTTTARQSIKVQGLEYGYKLGENGTYISSKEYSELPLPISGTSGVKSLRVTFNKFSDTINGGTVINTKTGENTIGKTTMYAQEGSNKVSIYQTGDTYTSNVNLTGGTIYIATSLKNYYKSDKKTINTYTPSFSEITKTATASTVYTVTGAHKYFIGDIMDYSVDYWNSDRSETIQGLAISDWATASTISVPYTFQIGAKQQTVVVPSTYTSVSGKDANSGPVSFNLVKTITFTNEQGYKSQYNVFVAPVLDGLNTESLINITIKK